MIGNNTLAITVQRPAVRPFLAAMIDVAQGKSRSVEQPGVFTVSATPDGGLSIVFQGLSAPEPAA